MVNHEAYANDQNYFKNCRDSEKRDASKHPSEPQINHWDVATVSCYEVFNYCKLKHQKKQWFHVKVFSWSLLEQLLGKR